MIRTTIREYYLLTCLYTLGSSMIKAMYATFLLSKGLNLFEAGAVNLFFFATLFLCEIPTGAFADVFGRKASVIFACVLHVIGMCVYGFSETMPGFITAEIILGIGVTFSSGALRAWFVDRLIHHGYDGKLNTIFARAQVLRQIAGIVAAVVGAYIAERSMTSTWIVGASLYVLTIACALRMKEEYFVRSRLSFAEGFNAMRQTVQASIRYGVNNVNVRFVLILVIAQILAVQGPNMQWQPFFVQRASGISSQGWVWMGIALSLMVGSWFAPSILKMIVDERKTLIICQIVIALALIATAFAGSGFMAMVIFFVHEAARGCFDPIKDAYLHDNIPSRERATIESFESLAHHGGGMIGLLASGYCAFKLGIPWTWGLSGAFLVLATIAVARRRRPGSAIVAEPCI